MTKQQIINCLRKYRYDPAHRWGKQGCTVANICALANAHRSEVKDLRDYGVSRGPRFLERIGRAIEMIENGEVKFINNFGKGPMEGSRKLKTDEPLWTIEWVNVPKRRPPPLEKIHRAEAHASWARCRTCQGDKWTAVVMNRAPYYVCDKCVGPVHWPGIGAKRADAEQRLEMFEQNVRESVSQLREG
jgi:hypothetical protein